MSAKKGSRRVYAVKGYEEPRIPRCQHGFIICQHDCQDVAALARAARLIAELTFSIRSREAHRAAGRRCTKPAANGVRVFGKAA